MASSQVEIASSSPPFGCVLRDHNQRDVRRESKWRKFFVKDRPNALVPMDSNRNKNENENRNSWLPKSNPKNKEKANLSVGMSPGHSTKKAKTERKPQEETLARSRSLGEASNLGAASLVQIWENRLNRSNSGKNQNPGGLSPTRSDSGLSSNEDEQSSRGSVTGDSVIADERFDTLADWHSDRTSPPSEQPSPCQSRSSDVGESERVRVIDIIKKLAAANENNNNNNNDHHGEQSGSPTLSDQVEQRFISHAIMSPRVRGRKAFTDLLMQIERERHSELKTLVERRVVSRFPQRGRIQSMLKLRSLQRGMAFQDRHSMRIVSPSLSQMERPPQASSITHLRERFSRQAENNAATSQSNDSENHRIEVSNKTKSSEYPTATRIRDEQTQSHEVIFIEQKDKAPVDEPSAFAVEDLHEEPCPSTSFACQETSSENRKLDSQGTVSEDRNLNPFASRSEDRNLDMQEMSLEVRNFDSQDALGTTEASMAMPRDVWDDNYAAEELEDNYSQYAEETSYDWITDISRSRRYWEDRRLEWYHEMLNPNSKNAEIRHLLERGTVTGFLASEFRERMDRLMEERLASQRQRQRHPVVVSQGTREDENTQLTMSPTTQHGHEREQQESDEEMGERAEHEESLMSGQYHEAGDYFDQSTSSLKIPSPSLLRSWSFRDNDQIESISPRQDDQNDQQCSSSTVHHHPSMETELIYELRGQMEQLYHEMSDLRQSLKSCMDLQMIIIQQSTKQDVHSGSGEMKNRSGDEAPLVAKKGKCCICYEANVDSLLYRCGHVCTCVKCAHELQWSSGKCPICCAPIVDVVRAFLDS